MPNRASRHHANRASLCSGVSSMGNREMNRYKKLSEQIAIR
ncbi:MAG TPA: hypothetical protein PLJ10_09735 [Candidatus Hydrogenedens sp.]|nr:hypothetical protein [Candidatus Hydrogenedens sp.]HOL19651.1 hypothetical protein [Candidatus Hydrogenedens sp.]